MQIPLFQIENAVVKRTDTKVLDIKKFEIHRGAIYSITGKPASGKSSLLDVLVRKIQVDSGNLLFDGKELAKYPTREFNENIAYVSQSVKAPWMTTVKQYLTRTLAKYSHLSKDLDKRIESIVNKMEISYLLDKPMRSLTPGQLRWVELATKIAADTKVLLIDEVEQHLSADAMNNLIRILHRKSTYDGVTIIITTLNPEPIKKMVSVYIAMQSGRISSVRSYSKGATRDKPRRPGYRDRKRPGKSGDKKTDRGSTPRKSEKGQGSGKPAVQKTDNRKPDQRKPGKQTETLQAEGGQPKKQTNRPPRTPKQKQPPEKS